jgi:hypothetical protein
MRLEAKNGVKNSDGTPSVFNVTAA